MKIVKFFSIIMLLSLGFVAISFFLPSVFVIAILAIFLGFALDITFEQTKIAIGSLEVLFGVYVAIVVESLFGPLERNPPEPNPAAR